MSQYGFWINCSLYTYTKDEIDIIVSKYREIWAERVRWEFDFFRKEENEVEWYAIKQFSKYNIKILWMIWGIIPGNLTNLIFPKLYFTPILYTTDLFLSFVERKVWWYKDYITHRQLRNEPNTMRFWITQPNAKDYVSLVKIMSDTIKNIQPHAMIVIWWIFYDNAQKFLPSYDKFFLQKCLDNNIDDYIDIYAIHPYNMSCYIWNKSVSDMISITIDYITSFRDNHESIKHKPLRVTEFGISDKWTKLSAKEQSSIYHHLFNRLQQENIPLFLWNIIDFEDKRYWWGNPEKHFGLLDSFLQEKIVYKELLYSLQQQ